MEEGDGVGARDTPPQGVFGTEADLLNLVEIHTLDDGLSRRLLRHIGRRGQFPGLILQIVEAEGAFRAESEASRRGLRPARSDRKQAGGGKSREQKTTIRQKHRRLQKATQ